MAVKKEGEKYRCNICGNEVAVTKVGGGTLVCCGKSMELLKQQLLQPPEKGEVMAIWRCTKCGYQLRQDVPPGSCPSCHEKCAFNDVTCYVPECGGKKNVDPRLS